MLRVVNLGLPSNTPKDGPPPRLERLRRWIAIEDVVLSAVLVVAPVLLGDRGAASAGSAGGGDVDVLGGLIYIVAVIGAIACLATRVPGESRLDSRERPDARLAAFGPLVGGIGFVGGDGVRKLGLDGGEIFMGITFVVALLAFALADRLPVVRPHVRRALVTPFVLVAAGIFEGIVGDITRGLDPAALVNVPAAELGLVATVAAIFVLAAAVFYAMLVYAPRELAEPGTPGRAWVVRFALFVASTVIGLILAPAVD